MNLKNAFKKAMPTILTVVSAGGVVATAVLSSKSALKAQLLLVEAEESKHDELTTFEVVQVATPAYIPAIAVGAMTIACIVGLRSYDKRQYAAAIAGYALIKRNYEKYQDKVKELLGIEEHRKITEAIAREVEHAKDHTIIAQGGFANSSTDFGLDEEKRLFYESFSGRYFESTISQVLQAEMHLNRNFIIGGQITANDFYDLLGIDHIKDGDILCWDVCEGYTWIDFDNHVTVLDDGLECCVIDMVFVPENYDTDVGVG
jgi:hypothetical protein